MSDSAIAVDFKKKNDYIEPNYDKENEKKTKKTSRLPKGKR